MLPLVQQAIISGFSAIQILKFIGSKFPNLKKGIDAAKASGFDDEKILKFLSQKLPYSKEGAERQLNANDQYLSSIGFKTKQERETARNKALQGALGVGAAALGTYALSRAIPASVSSLMGLKEPQEQNQALKAISSPDQLQNIQTTNDAQQPPNIETAPTIPQQLNIQQDENERRRVEALKRFNEKVKKPGFAEKELDRFLETYAPEEPKIEEPKPEEIKEPKKIEKSSIVASPQGIGEVKEIRNGKALVDIDGTLHKVDEDKLEGEPVDLEPAVRYIMDNIPEKLKSTAFESSIHLRIPRFEDIMLVKFYDGKWAWYLDVPENLYSDIATGVYEPKTAGKTGIAEYKPGVIDSRGAGFQSEIVQNPKYGKNEKGKTWGYALTKYNALEQIQESLKNISKERYDEQGNLIKPKKRKKGTD